MIIAIDGPAGAGKSTVAKAVAKKLGFSCLDTGAMYRAVALAAIIRGISLDDADALGTLAKDVVIDFAAPLNAEGNHQALPNSTSSNTPQKSRVLLDGKDVTAEIRTPEIDKAVSPVSATPSVRTALVAQQQRIGAAGDYVVEGRDIGTVVFPNAEVKIFLTASNEERAHRRVRQNVDRGVGSIDYEEVLADIIRRDKVDSSRATSPLKPAEDATILDSTGSYIEDVIDQICTMATKAKE